MADNYAMDTAARFGEIPFTEFTRDLITGTFEALLDAELKQLQAYTDMVGTLATNLSDYINNTHDDIPLTELTAFIQNLNLPTPADVTALTSAITSAWSTFQGGNAAPTTTSTTPVSGTIPGSVLQQILGALPAVSQTVLQLLQTTTGNNPPAFPATVDLNHSTPTTATTPIFGQTVPGGQQIPNYNILYKAIAGKIANDKYALLQNMVRMGMMRMVIDAGVIETRITFNTWESASNETENKDRNRNVNRTVRNAGFIPSLIRRTRERQRHVTVTTAKSEHRDAHGSSVQIFGRVQINFKTDYLPLASSQQ